MATLVNAVFRGARIETAPPPGTAEAPPPLVEVRTPASAFKLMEALRDLLLPPDDDVLLLVHRRRGNRPLCTLLNALSRAGRRVHLHGVDADESSTEGKLRCSTWWGAKGLECDTAVVLLPEGAPRNPTYVALTRARRRLVLVLDPKAPHAAVARAVATDAADAVVTRGAAARMAAAAPSEAAVAASLCTVPFAPRAPGALRCLDRRVPRREAMARGATRGEGAPPDDDEALADESVPVAINGVVEDVREAAWRVALVRAECAATGRVRAMEDVLRPTRFGGAVERDAAMRGGFVGRSVGRFARDDELLAPDLRAAATAAYAQLRADPTDASAGAEVALAVLAWDGFDHVMRQQRPVAAWAAHAAVARAAERAVAALPPGGTAGVEYDVPLLAGDAYARVHAVDAERAYHVVWGRSNATVGEAAVRAALHPRGACALVDLAAGVVEEVRAHEAATLLAEPEEA